MRLLHLLVFSLFTVALVAQNIRVHDPVAIKQGETYYIFSTGKGISVFSSTDLIHWEQQPQVFTEEPVWADDVAANFNNHIWAPDISFHKGNYYLYYSVSAFGKNTSAIGLTINKTLDAKDPNYKWEDQGIIIQSVPNRDMWNAIDPNLVIDQKGTPYLAFGSFWEGLKMVKLNPDLQAVAQPQEWHTIARRKRDFDMTSINSGNAAIEAPFIFKKGDWFYLFVSWDLCCKGEDSTYKVVVGRSKNVTGPYKDKDGVNMSVGGGTLLVEGNKDWHGAGHNSAYTFNGTDYIIFHAYDAHDNGKSKLQIKELDWDAEGWPVVKE